MLPRRETTSRWADICLYTGSERSEVDCLSTTDRGSLRQPGICWYASANLCQEVLVDIQELLITYGSAQKIRYQRASPVCCVRGLLTAATLDFLLCFDIELPGNGIEFVSFILYCCLQNHLLPGMSPLLFESQLYDSKETYLRLIFVFGNCIRICPNYFFIYPKPIFWYFLCLEGGFWAPVWNVLYVRFYRLLNWPGN